MGTPDSREYDRLKERNFRPYSKGHRYMYEEAIRQISAREDGPVTILEAGFGIGWGLERMIESGIVLTYLGCEPNKDSFDYVAGRIVPEATYELIHAPFTRDLTAKVFDYAFCVEVIEHVPMDAHPEFLKALRDRCEVLYFSTPDKQRVPKEGVRTTAEWVRLLNAAGFSNVTVDKSKWTYLYRCE